MFHLSFHIISIVKLMQQPSSAITFQIKQKCFYCCKALYSCRNILNSALTTASGQCIYGNKITHIGRIQIIWTSKERQTLNQMEYANCIYRLNMKKVQNQPVYQNSGVKILNIPGSFCVSSAALCYIYHTCLLSLHTCTHKKQNNYKHRILEVLLNKMFFYEQRGCFSLVQIENVNSTPHVHFKIFIIRAFVIVKQIYSFALNYKFLFPQQLEIDLTNSCLLVYIFYHYTDWLQHENLDIFRRNRHQKAISAPQKSPTFLQNLYIYRIIWASLCPVFFFTI